MQAKGRKNLAYNPLWAGMAVDLKRKVFDIAHLI